MQQVTKGKRMTGFTSSIPEYRNFASKNDRQEYANIINLPVEDVPNKRGYSYPQIIDAIDKGEIKALWIVATNPLVSYPDQNKLRKALRKLDLLVVQDAFKSESALKADVVF
jgi:assimilatory nitrate reductase catalytic subunit